MVSPTSRDLFDASRSLLSALQDTAPAACDVAAIVPAIREADAPGAALLEDVADAWTAPVARRELAAAWSMGMTLGAAGGMVHSPTLMAPLVRHDRAHNHDQSVVTLWSLEPWTAPEGLDRRQVMWQRAMLRRAARYADAVVVPTHAMAAELGEIAALRGRVRVIAGAPAAGFDVPSDAEGVARKLGLPETYVVYVGTVADAHRLLPVVREAAGPEVGIVVLGERNDSIRIAESTAVESAPPGVHSPGVAGVPERAGVLSGALAVLAPSTAAAFPWRAVEALGVGAPLIASRTAQNEELLVDGAHFTPRADVDAIGDALGRIAEDGAFADRLRVLSADRARAFSWRDAAEHVWQLHAEL